MFSIISSLFFYLFPTLIGRAIIGKKDKGIPYPLVTYFVLGCLSIFGVFLIDKYIVLPFFEGIELIRLLKYSLIAVGIIAVCVIASTGLIKAKQSPLRSFAKYRLVPGFASAQDDKWPVLFSLALSLFIYILWQAKTPYPLNWDFLEHQTLVNNILSGKFSFFTSEITDTFVFNGYSSLFHSLLASAQILIPFEIINFWLSISYFHLFLVVLASYYLAFEVSGNKKIGLLSAVFGGFVFESITFTSLFLIPQTFTAVFFVFLITQLIAGAKNNNLPKLPIVILSCIFILLNHYIVGLVAASIYIAVFLYFKYGERLLEKVGKTSFIEASIFFSIVLILFSSVLPLGFINQGEAASFNFSVSDKFTFLQRAYGYSFLLFLPFGVLFILKRKKTLESLILFISLAVLLIVFTSIPYSFKFFVLGRFFINVILAFGAYYFIGKITKPSLYYLSIFFLTLFLSFVFIANSIFWKSNLYYKETFSHISKDELEAALFLKQNYGKEDTLLVSDPATSYILETFSGVNSQGGAYTNSYTRERLIDIAKTKNTSLILENLFLIKDSVEDDSDKRLFALSGRYFQWQNSKEKEREGVSFNIWTPSDLTYEDKKYFKLLLSDFNHFKLVYDNPTIAIFETTKPRK